MNKKHIFLFLLCAFLWNRSFAQLSVDPLTGAANVNIPIYVVKSGQVDVPVSLSYNGTGIRPKDVEGTAGMGWQLNAGGQISRSVRGLPDDCTKDNNGNTRLGWMIASNTTPANIAGFTIANNGLTCSYETTDLSYIHTNFSYSNDSEPDMFYVSAPGLSCQLVYNRDSTKFKPIGYQDLIITYTVLGGTGNNANDITSFTITNDKGIKYVFAASESVTQTTRPKSGAVPTFFGTKYNQYINGITFNDSWSLSSITDANGNGINLSYNTSPATTGADSVALYIGGLSSYTLQYKIVHSSVAPVLYNIQTTNLYTSKNVLTFNWTTAPSTGQSVISSITGSGRSFQFTYLPVTYTPTSYNRSFLRSFSDPGTNTPVNYQFAYAGETALIGGAAYTTILPDSASVQRDYWGYYSSTASTTTLVPSVYVNPYSTAYQRYLIKVSASPGSIYAYTLTNSNRSADPTVAAVGSLNKITYVQGGSTNIIYEPNDYYDVPSSSVIQGGGIRVKQVIDSVARGSTNNSIRNYIYVNPSTGVSSGKPISLPQFAYTIPYSGSATGVTLWTDATALSAYDLSPEDHTIMYGYSKVSQTGAGSTLYQYYLPATYWDISAAPSCGGCTSSEWYPTLNEMGRSNCSASTYGPIANYIYSYPFIPNPNYDFERGLPQKVTSYNDAGSEVSESNYTYQRSYSPMTITAFKTDSSSYSGLLVQGYNKYKIYWNTSELTTKVVSKVYDSQSLGQVRADSVTYTYGSSYHKLVTQEQSTNSDGSLLTKNIRYVKDFVGVASGTNPNVTALYNLLNEHINIPVEIYGQTNRGGSTTTTSAALTLFRDTTTGSTVHCLPSQQFKWIQPGGATYTPMSISGQTLTKDASYFGVANYDFYDNTGFPLTVDDNDKNIQTTLVNHSENQVIASFSNAAYNQIAYSDLDNDYANPAFGFSITGTGSYTPVGSHAGNAAGLATTQTVTSPTLAKHAVAQNYIFSVWMNATTAGTLTLTLSGFSTHPSISYAGNSKWTYYELKIPVGTLSSSYTVSFTASTNISIDDILFYPDVVQTTTATYDPTTHYKLDATNTNGVSAYYTNDQWGRLTYAYDQDKNIVQKNTYVTAGEVKDYSNMTIYATAPVVGSPSTFTIYGYDVSSGATVTWNFGDGSAPVVVPLTTSPTHTYAVFGSYTVTAAVNSPLFGPKTIHGTAVVNPANITLSYGNNQATGTGNLTTITFSQGGVVIYSFTSATIAGSVIRQGVYNIQVAIYNPMSRTDYCVILTADCWYGCSNYTASTTLNFSYTADLSTCHTLNVFMSNANCGTPP